VKKTHIERQTDGKPDMLTIIIQTENKNKQNKTHTIYMIKDSVVVTFTSMSHDAIYFYESKLLKLKGVTSKSDLIHKTISR